MPTLSVILITCNEEANLRDCLASLGGLPQQVVIVDMASTDGTIAIAQEFGATITQPADWPGFGPQKNRALDLATGDWVLSLDADERLTPALQAEIAGVLEKPGNVTCFAIPRLSWYCGRFIRHRCFCYFCWHLLFKNISHCLCCYFIKHKLWIIF
jgi:glycosyltransferase involved in cell wall biosynthesis